MQKAKYESRVPSIMLHMNVGWAVLLLAYEDYHL